MVFIDVDPRMLHIHRRNPERFRPPGMRTGRLRRAVGGLGCRAAEKAQDHRLRNSHRITLEVTGRPRPAHFAICRATAWEKSAIFALLIAVGMFSATTALQKAVLSASTVCAALAFGTALT